MFWNIVTALYITVDIWIIVRNVKLIKEFFELTEPDECSEAGENLKD